ncbi:hypothetical protein ACGC1H_000155 [Rhizoctonia solani]
MRIGRIFFHTQNNFVPSLLDNKAYISSSNGASTTVMPTTTNSFTNQPLNSSDATREILSTFPGNFTNITILDTTAFLFPTSQLPLARKPHFLSNITICHTLASPLLPFINAPASAASTTTLLLILTGRKVPEGINGLSTSLQTELEERKLWAYEDAPISRDNVGSGAQKSNINGTSEWLEFATTNVFNQWRINTTDEFPLKDVGDW